MATKTRRRSGPAPLPMPPARVVLIEDPEKLRHGLGLLASEAASLRTTLAALLAETRQYVHEVRERVYRLTNKRVADLDALPDWQQAPSLAHRQTILSALQGELDHQLRTLQQGAQEMQRALRALDAAPPGRAEA